MHFYTEQAVRSLMFSAGKYAAATNLLTERLPVQIPLTPKCSHVLKGKLFTPSSLCKSENKFHMCGNNTQTKKICCLLSIRHRALVARRLLDITLIR